jgi:hypothetical protein
MRSTKEQKQLIAKTLKGFDKPKHAEAMAAGILRSINDGSALPSRIDQANSVVKAVRDRGVTSAFAVEYGKLFTDPDVARSTREKLMATFEVKHSLPTKRAAKMADCIVFSAAKKPEADNTERLSNICAAALKAGVPFTIVADVVYYNAPDVTAEKFAKRCIDQSIKRNKPLAVSEVDLASKISKALA